LLVEAPQGVPLLALFGKRTMLQIMESLLFPEKEAKSVVPLRGSVQTITLLVEAPQGVPFGFFSGKEQCYR
jgi:hypothetical protein